MSTSELTLSETPGDCDVHKRMIQHELLSLVLSDPGGGEDPVTMTRRNFQYTTEQRSHTAEQRSPYAEPKRLFLSLNHRKFSFFFLIYFIFTNFVAAISELKWKFIDFDFLKAFLW